MYQFDEERDASLNDLEDRLAVIVGEQKDLARDHDAVWNDILDTMQVSSTPGTVRFICQDGFVLAKEERTSAPRLNTARLRALIFDRYLVDTAEKVWQRVTTLPKDRVIDQEKLAKAVASGLLKPEIIQESTIAGKVTAARTRRMASKTDAEVLAAGIFTSPEEAQEGASIA